MDTERTVPYVLELNKVSRQYGTSPVVNALVDLSLIHI